MSNEIDLDACHVVALEQLSRVMGTFMSFTNEFRKFLLGHPDQPIPDPASAKDKKHNEGVHKVNKNFGRLRQDLFNGFVEFLSEDGPAPLTVRKAALASVVDRFVEVKDIYALMPNHPDQHRPRNIDDIVGEGYWLNMETLMVKEVRTLVALTQPTIEVSPAIQREVFSEKVQERRMEAGPVDLPTPPPAREVRR